MADPVPVLKTPRWRLILKPLLIIGLPAMAIGWLLTTMSSRVLYVGVGPGKTTFRHMALEAAAEMSNKIEGARFVFCTNRGTREALQDLSRPSIPLIGNLFQPNCSRLDIAAITDGTQLRESYDGVQLLAPFYKSYLQVYSRAALNIADVQALMKRRSAYRIGVPVVAQATFDRVCIAMYTMQSPHVPLCDLEAIKDLGFAQVVAKESTADLVALMKAGKLDVVVAGGPVCPEGTEALNDASGVSVLSWPTDIPSMPTESTKFACLGGASATSVVAWTLLVAAPDVRLSKAELHAALMGLNEVAKRYTATTFANFNDLSGWPKPGPGGLSSPFGYSPMVERYNKLKLLDPGGVASDTVWDFITLRQPQIQFFALLLGIIGSVVTLAGKFRKSS